MSLLHQIEAAEQVAAVLEDALRPHGLTLRAFRALCLLQERPHHQRELARALGRNASNVTSLVDGLEQGGLVRRTVPPEDRRRSVVTLTDAGKARLEEAREAVAMVDR